MLFITVACGACSGFHSLIASGTTSKQLRNETDAKSGRLRRDVARRHGGRRVAVLRDDVRGQCFAELTGKSSEQIYAAGIGKFVKLRSAGSPTVLRITHTARYRSFGITFALMAFTTFVYDTLDVCTRLGRFIIQELTGRHNWSGRLLGTALTAGVPLFFLLRHPDDLAKPVWQIFWPLFGASNQLLAALTLLGVTVWLWQTQRAALGVASGRPAGGMDVRHEHLGLVSMTYADLWHEGKLVALPNQPGAVHWHRAARVSRRHAGGSDTSADFFQPNSCPANAPA